jgi:hypothetical protein
VVGERDALRAPRRRVRLVARETVEHERVGQRLHLGAGGGQGSRELGDGARAGGDLAHEPPARVRVIEIAAPLAQALQPLGCGQQLVERDLGRVHRIRLALHDGSVSARSRATRDARRDLGAPDGEARATGTLRRP